MSSSILLGGVYTFLAYLAGSISSAILICRVAGLPDPRKSGSKNPGATNVLRVAGKKAAVATLVGDVLKGFLPVYLAIHTNPFPEFVGPVMVAVFLGHLYPVFFGFQGGKGVATAIGALLALNALLGSMLVATWGVVVLAFRISSLGALVAAAAAPLYVWWLLGASFSVPVAIIGGFIFWRHRGNIQRLLQGTEPRLGKR